MKHILYLSFFLFVVQGVLTLCAHQVTLCAHQVNPYSPSHSHFIHLYVG